jgi:hypothetical protein
MKGPLAGADAAGRPTETLLSEVGPVLLRLFDMREACALRLVCREFVEAVEQHQWEDRRTVIRGSLVAWRACFPRARCASVRGRAITVQDADFVHLEGLRELNMAGCTAVTDAAFVHLRAIHTLDMSRCPGITDAAIVHLRGIHTLDLGGCMGITGATISSLAGVQVLRMLNCSQAAVTAARGQGLMPIAARFGRIPVGLNERCVTCGTLAQGRGSDGLPYCSVGCLPDDV